MVKAEIVSVMSDETSCSWYDYEGDLSDFVWVERSKRASVMELHRIIIEKRAIGIL
jgi:hypothetical protein